MRKSASAQTGFLSNTLPKPVHVGDHAGRGYAKHLPLLILGPRRRSRGPREARHVDAFRMVATLSATGGRSHGASKQELIANAVAKLQRFAPAIALRLCRVPAASR
jgi:hypothetical protein